MSSRPQKRHRKQVYKYPHNTPQSSASTQGERKSSSTTQVGTYKIELKKKIASKDIKYNT
jgi:hypothetical protein